MSDNDTAAGDSLGLHSSGEGFDVDLSSGFDAELLVDDRALRVEDARDHKRHVKALARNARRERAGKAPLDVEAEVARQLADLGPS